MKIYIPEFAAALNVPSPKIVYLGEFEFPQGILRLTTALFDIDWRGEVWRGFGGAPGEVRRTPIQDGGRPLTFSYRLAADPALLNAQLESVEYRNRPQKLYFGALDANDNLVDDWRFINNRWRGTAPEAEFSGRMLDFKQTLNPNEFSVELDCGSLLLTDWDSADNLRVNGESQMAKHRHDPCMNRVSEQVKESFYF